jgi:hypothetical protein
MRCIISGTRDTKSTRIGGYEFQVLLQLEIVAFLDGELDTRENVDENGSELGKDGKDDKYGRRAVCEIERSCGGTFEGAAERVDEADEEDGDGA